MNPSITKQKCLNAFTYGMFWIYFLTCQSADEGRRPHQHAAHGAREQTLVCPTLTLNSLNMHSSLITLEMNPSGSAVTGARR